MLRVQLCFLIRVMLCWTRSRRDGDKLEINFHCDNSFVRRQPIKFNPGNGLYTRIITSVMNVEWIERLLTERKIYHPGLIATFICSVRAIRTERERNWSISFNEKNLIRFMEVSDDLVGTVMRAGKTPGRWCLVRTRLLQSTLSFCLERVEIRYGNRVTTCYPVFLRRERESCKSYEFYTQNGNYISSSILFPISFLIFNLILIFKNYFPQ